jgi:hypothetical protein
MSTPSLGSKYKPRAGFLHGLFLDPDDGGDTFLQNVSWLSMDYMALYIRSWNSFDLSCFLDSFKLTADSFIYL